MSDQRPAAMHPEHPGIGSPTSLVRLEGDDPEVGGVLMFLPSGRHLTIRWRTLQPIEPTVEACQRFTGSIMEQLADLVAGKEAARDPRSPDQAKADLLATNWTSVAAAIQRIILEFNEKLALAASRRWAEEFGDRPMPRNIHRTH